MTFGTSGYTLEGIPLFDGTDHPAIASALADCPVLHVKNGQTLDSPEANGPMLHVVLRGALSVTRAPGTHAKDGSAPERTVLKVLPGECTGELSVLDDVAGTDHLTALMDSDVLVIEGEKLWKLVDASNGVARNLLRLLSFRARAAGAHARRNRKAGDVYRQLSLVDALTGLQNRTWLNEHLPTMVENAHIVGSPMALIMVDLDHFKQFNDLHGHVSGDHALQVAARVVRDGLRPTDFAARFGGEEMLVILPATQQKSALMVAQRLRDRLRQAVVFSELHKPLPHITASFGVATLEPGQHAEALISAADAALSRAKEDGRDRVAL
jgi:diguanylate cyclase (GGDEF)-like protein